MSARITFTFRRWWSFALFLAILLAWPILHHLRTYPLDDAGVESIRTEIRAGYAARLVEELGGLRTAGDKAVCAAKEAGLVRPFKVQVRAMAKGLLWPKYVRAELTIDGKVPPDGKSVRYFRCGWFGANRRSNPVEYYVFFW
ncbi:MAG: hypothetical protein M3463_05380 [Verrucomicrobiota bacterium]|nr:hypothetical protein [Verrucomicrobiota bacterium]